MGLFPITLDKAVLDFGPSSGHCQVPGVLYGAKAMAVVRREAGLEKAWALVKHYLKRLAAQPVPTHTLICQDLPTGPG